jgi:monovalent cation:H+ antiporter-2, CPA2 family
MQLGWSTGGIFLLAVTFIFNSTAVVSEFLRKNNELYSATGKMVLNILLLQDIMLAPVLAVLQVFNKGEIQFSKFLLSIIVCILIFLLLRAIRNRDLFQFRFIKEMESDHELQVFAGALIALGFAVIASFIRLSPAIGSFIAGIYIGRTNAFHWLEHVLRPFKIFFVAFFFLSVGLMLDLNYILDQHQLILLATLVSWPLMAYYQDYRLR